MNSRSGRSAKTVDKIGKAVTATLLLAFSAPIFLVLLGLAWIALRPLPHIPRYSVQYSLKDAGPVGSDYLDFYGSNSLGSDWSLTPTGTVAQLDATAEASDKTRRAEAVLRLGERLGFRPDPDAIYNTNPVVAVSPTDQGLVFQGDMLWFWQNGHFAEAISRNVRGYPWKIYDERFYEINAQNIVIGDGRIATAGASSGGFSSPHGRFMPLVWQPGYRQPEDLNSRIDPTAGWYLDQTVDINGRGQILCVGRRTDEKGAEEYQQADAHWVVMTPIAAPLLTDLRVSE